MIAVAGAIGGALLTGAVTYVSQVKIEQEKTRLEAQLEQQKAKAASDLEVQKAQMELQLEQQREKFELENAHGEMARTRAEDDARALDGAHARYGEHLQAVATIEAHMKGGDYNSLWIDNQTDSQIEVALHYQALDKLWVTTGWTKVPARQKLETDARTQSDHLAFYARNRSCDLVRIGDEHTYVKESIDNDSDFAQIDNDVFLGRSPRIAPFSVVRFEENPNSWVSMYVGFSCGHAHK